MKFAIALIISCFFHFSYAQKEIANWSHPFQVLFADSASYIGEERKVGQFDFLEKYDLIHNKGELVLVHYTGELIVLDKEILNIRELSKKYHMEGEYQRPIISDPTLFINNSANNKNRHKPVGTGVVLDGQEIELLIPQSTDGIDLFFPKESKELFIAWQSHWEDVKYMVRFKNIFDEILYQTETQTPYLTVSRGKINVEKDFVIIELNVIGMANTKSGYGIRFREMTAPNKYQYLVNALIAQWNGETTISKYLFKHTITVSDNDPRFMSLYEEFQKESTTPVSASE